MKVAGRPQPHRLGRGLLVLLLIPFLLRSAGATSRLSARQWVNLINERIEHHDLLGARVIIRKVDSGQISPFGWYVIRGIIFRHPELGQDLVLRGDRYYLSQGSADIHDNYNAALMKADHLLLSRQWDKAFNLYQKVAENLKRIMHSHAIPAIRSNARALYPYVLHGMARALFSAGRLKEAWDVYTWITPEYPHYRQVLFERMWTAFKSGRVDLALGAIADQRSAYFSKYLEPESYLLQIYLYKILCREKDLDLVLAEISEFKKHLNDGTYSYLEWAKSEFYTRALLQMLKAKTDISTPEASSADRIAEQNQIRSLLERMFASAKKRLLNDLTVVQAYSNLAVTPGMQTGLKPIKKLKSRQALFKLNLEIWPAATSEEWADELGYHRFIGESQCKNAR